MGQNQIEKLVFWHKQKQIISFQKLFILSKYHMFWLSYESIFFYLEWCDSSIPLLLRPKYTLLPFHVHDHWNSWMSVFVRYFRSILRFWRFICTSIVNSWVHKAVLLHFHTPPPLIIGLFKKKKKQTGGRLSKYFLEPPGVFHFFTLRLTPPLEIP